MNLLMISIHNAWHNVCNCECSDVKVEWVMGPPISLHMISTHHARRNTHTHKEERQRYSWVGTPGTTVRAWFRARPSCRGCGQITGLFLTFEKCVLPFVCGGRVGKGFTNMFLHDFDAPCATKWWDIWVSMYRSHASLVHQTFFARCWYTMYNNSLRIACFVS